MPTGCETIVNVASRSGGIDMPEISSGFVLGAVAFVAILMVWWRAHKRSFKVALVAAASVGVVALMVIAFSASYGREHKYADPARQAGYSDVNFMSDNSFVGVKDGKASYRHMTPEGNGVYTISQEGVDCNAPSRP